MEGHVVKRIRFAEKQFCFAKIHSAWDENRPNL